jgi:hypothetical protein
VPFDVDLSLEYTCSVRSAQCYGRQVYGMQVAALRIEIVLVFLLIIPSIRNTKAQLGELRCWPCSGFLGHAARVNKTPYDSCSLES